MASIDESRNQTSNDSFKFITRDESDPKYKPKIYFSCHPDDFDKYFPKVCEILFGLYNCAVCHSPDMSKQLKPEEIEFFSNFVLFVVPVSQKLLEEENRAMEFDLPMALQNKIPVLPLMVEEGLYSLFSIRFGKMQYLKLFETNDSSLSYKEKLEKYLSSVLLDNKLEISVRSAFDAYIFLSYRKKDRSYANDLIKKIHSISMCEGVAIWYDEFLVPGENYNENIQNNLRNSRLFVLLVTPNLISEENYVHREEYPEAIKANKTIIPVEVVDTDHSKLHEWYNNLPPIINGCVDEELYECLSDKLTDLNTLTRDNENEHKYLIGLAYLYGIDMPKDSDRGIQLIVESARDGYLDAIDRLVDIYEKGIGVEINLELSVEYLKNSISVAEQKYGKKDEEVYKRKESYAYRLQGLGRFQESLIIWWDIYDYMEKSYGDDDIRSLRAKRGLAKSYDGNHCYEQASKKYEELYHIQKEKYGEYNIETIQTLGDLASVYKHMTNYDASLNLYTRIYENCIKLGLGNSAFTLKYLCGVASVYGLMGKCEKANSIYTQVLEMQQKQYGENNYDALITMHSIAANCFNLGELNQAHKILNDVYKKRCKILGDDAPMTLETLRDLAIVSKSIGLLDESRRMVESVLAKQKESNENTIEISITLKAMAEIYEALGLYELQWNALKEACDNYEKMYGFSDLNTINLFKKLGRVSVNVGKREYVYDLLEKLRKEYEIQVNALGQESKTCLTIKYSIADLNIYIGEDAIADEQLDELIGDIKNNDTLSLSVIYSAKATIAKRNEDYKSAVWFYTLAFQYEKEKWAENKISTLDYLDYLAWASYKSNLCYLSLAIYDLLYEKYRAVYGETYDRTLAVAKNRNNLNGKTDHYSCVEDCELEYNVASIVFGDDNITSLTVLKRLADLLYKLNKFDKALEKYTELFQKHEKIYGENHEKTISFIMSMANCYYSLKEYEKAIIEYRKVYDLRKESKDEVDVNTIRILGRIGTIFFNESRFEEARKLYEEEYNELKRIIGEDNDDTSLAKFNLAGALFELKSYIESLSLYYQVYHYRRNKYGIENEKTLFTLRVIKKEISIVRKNASDSYDENDINGSIRLLEPLLDFLKTCDDEYKRELILVYIDLSFFYGKKGNFNDQMNLLNEAKIIAVDSFGLDDKDTLIVIGNIGVVYGFMGNYQKQLEIEKEVYDKRLALLGREDLLTIKALYHIGIAKWKLGDVSGSREVLVKVYEQRKELLGLNHIETQKVYETLMEISP